VMRVEDMQSKGESMLASITVLVTTVLKNT
jgi:hypothetical protein